MGVLSDVRGVANKRNANGGSARYFSGFVSDTKIRVVIALRYGPVRSTVSFQTHIIDGSKCYI